MIQQKFYWIEFQLHHLIENQLTLQVTFTFRESMLQQIQHVSHERDCKCQPFM